MSLVNLWQGKLVDNDEFISQLDSKISDAKFWAKPPLSHYVLFDVITKIQNLLLKKGDFYQALVNDLKSREDISSDEIQYSMDGLVEFLSIDQLRVKLKRELGSEFPFELKRQNAREDHFEAWYPLGTLVHITPNNSPLLGVLGVIEGLLSGNVNILKLARKDSSFASLFYKELCQLDSSNTLKDYVYIAKVSSKEKKYLKKILSLADVVSAWGGEESVQSVRELTPKGVRVVEWGHKISFSYVTQKMSTDEKVFLDLAYEICLNEQMACSSPQCLFLEDATVENLREFAKHLGATLKTVSANTKRVLPGLQESAELMVTKEQVRLGSILGESELIESKNNDWRIYLDLSPTLNSSPLFRTIWLKPMPRKKLIDHLRPLKTYLQTAGIAAHGAEVEELCRDLFMSGVQRVRAIGEMTDSYIGEPHDGVYALERYCQRINFHDSKGESRTKMMNKKCSFEDQKTIQIQRTNKIMEKSDFQNQKIESKYSDLFFYSGGSSGEPKLSVFTYEDYHRQMELAAEGLYAAGLEPALDRCMNLFYAGSLYGGFTSFFTILEKLHAVHFPMGASTDFKMVGKTIVDNGVNTLLGMPSYLLQLFNENADLFKSHRVIKKIFYGGEHFSEAQKNRLKNFFGVEVIRSASYGSVDAGPLGFQCEFATGGIHHLHEKLHDLEVVDLEVDKAIDIGEVGRFLFSSKVRHGQKIERYAIGDVGRVLEGACPCGRSGKRFELLGRHGDVFRIGTTFLSYQKFQKVLLDKYDFSGALQIQLYSGDGVNCEKVLLLVENTFTEKYSNEDLVNDIISNYSDLKTVVREDKVLTFEVDICKREKLIYSPTTGKLKSVIDHRTT